MFTGFASENTPAIQVWDFSKPFGTSTADRNIALTDDCAPIQVILTGGSVSGTVNVILPNAPIEGKQIKIINASYGTDNSGVSIKSADFSGFGTLGNVVLLGTSQTIDLCYSKYFISNAITSSKTGWISLNQAAISSPARGAVAFGDLVNAIGLGSAAIGGTSNTAIALYSSVVGGSSNTASGSRAAVVGGQTNTASSTNAAVVGGTNGTASAANSAVVGGATGTASGTRSSVIGGATSTASSNNAVVVGGNTNAANSFNSVVVGGSAGSARSIVGNFVYPSSDAPISFLAGGQQLATLLLGRQTTDATATRLTSDTNSASTTNQVILPNNSAYYVKGSVIATVTGGGNTKSWDFIATIKRGANAAATSIVGAVTLNVQAADAGASTWIVAITADTTNGGLAVTVTGQAATTIRWVAKLESTEVTY